MPRRKRLEDAYEGTAQVIEGSGAQAAQAIQDANQQYIDAANAAQQLQNEQWGAARSTLENSLNEGYGGMEAIIAAGEERLKREQEIANAEYLASQKAASVSGLTHLAASLGNLIGVGFFNAPHSDYQNPSVDWMKKADQDKQIARQRMDNLRDRQRQVQQQLLQMKISGAGQLAGMDMDSARQGYQHGINMANAQREGARDIASLNAQTAQQAAQTRLQGTTAGVQLEMQEAQLAEQRRYREEQAQIQREHYAAQDAINMARYGLQQDPATGEIKPIVDSTGRPIGPVSSRSGSGSGGSTSGNNYAVTVDGQRIVLGMNTETYNSAIQSGKKAIQQDVMDAAGFKGTWDEFVEAASSDKIKNPEGRGKIANPLNAYSDIIAALNYNGRDQDEAKSMNAILEDYVARNSDATNNFNKHLVDVSNRQRDAAYVPQSTEQAAAVAATTPSQQRRAPEQPTRVETRNGKLVTVDSVTGEVLHEGADTAAQPQLNWEDKVQWK